jgi:2-haloacid dehalogenase
MFKLAQQRTAVAPGQWLHVAQSVYHDVIPARSLGMTSVWVNRPSPRPGSGAAKSASAKPDLEVPNLKTLAELTENREL